MLLVSLSLAASALAFAGCAYLIIAAALVRRFLRGQPAARLDHAPAVTILKPLHGDEPGLAENLASFRRQHYRAPIQLVCGVQSATDPAIAAVEMLQRQHPNDIELVVDASRHGSNDKVSNLVNMAGRTRHDVVVLADSDIRVDADYLPRVLAALQRPEIASVTCLYHGLPLGGALSRLSALAINAHFLPSVVVGLASGRARPCFGSTIALTRRRLAEIGGFLAFADRLDDDYAIGQALRSRGEEVAVPPFTVAHVCAPRSLRSVWQNEVRWARTIRNIDPAGHIGSAITHPFAWGVIGALLGAGSFACIVGLLAALAALACRLALVRRVESLCGVAAAPAWLVPVRDVLSFLVFLMSLYGREVRWRGRRYRMGGREGLAAAGDDRAKSR